MNGVGKSCLKKEAQEIGKAETLIDAIKRADELEGAVRISEEKIFKKQKSNINIVPTAEDIEQIRKKEEHREFIDREEIEK